MKNHFALFLSEPNKTKLGASPYPIFLLSCRNSETLKYASAEERHVMLLTVIIYRGVTNFLIKIATT